MTTDLDLLTPERTDEVPAGAVRLLDHGFIALADRMPLDDADERIVWAARRSYQRGTTTFRDNVKLIRYLLENKHMTPFEHPVCTTHWFLPLFVQNQLVRHRTGSFSILSLRYSEVTDKFYVPQYLRTQDGKNRQSSSERVGDPVLEDDLIEAIKSSHRHAMTVYQAMIEKGVAREQARGVIPTNVYSDLVMTMDLRNLLHLLELRWHPHAQPEFQVYARALAGLLEDWAPATMTAWREMRGVAAQGE